MYYSIKIVLYETGEILESSRFYAKQGEYSIQIRSESGRLLFGMLKLQSDMFEVSVRTGWRDDELLWVTYTDTNPIEEDL